MNSKLIGAVVVIIIVILIGVYLVKGGAKYTKPQTQEQTPVTQTQETPTATQGATQQAKETTVSVTTDGFFGPKTVTIKAGERVIWINKSGGTANVSSVVHPTHLVYPPLNLGNFEDGEKVELVFDKPGTYKYHNHLNPSQTGEVVVE